MFNFVFLDYLVVFLYVIILVGIIVLSSKNVKSASEFKLGGKKFGTLAIMATQGASMKGSASLIGYAGGAWTSGIGVLFASQCYNMGGWVAVMIGLARRLKKSADQVNIQSLGDIFKHRYQGDKATRVCSGLMTGWLSMATVSGQLAAIGLLLYLATGKYGVTYVQCVSIAGVIVVACTIFGGIVSVIYTDVFQWFVMTPTIFILIPIFCILNGATPENVHQILPKDIFFSLKPSLAWLTLLIGGLLTSVTDIVYLTRYISAKDERTAVRGSSFGFLYTTLWAGIVIVFGLAAAVIVTPDMITEGKDQVLYTLMGIILPPGVLGIFAAALFATTISTIDSYLHTAVVAVTADMKDVFYTKEFTEKQELNFVRIVTVILTLISIFAVLKLKGIIAIFNLGWSMYASVTFAPVIATLYWRKSTAASSLVGMAFGGATFLYANFNAWKLPVLWGVGVSIIAIIIVALIQNKETPLLPGFQDSGKIVKGHSQDCWIFVGALVGCIGSLLVSVGVAMWFNWIILIVGLAVMASGIKMLAIGTPTD